jgi:hypothetical protein
MGPIIDRQFGDNDFDGPPFVSYRVGVRWDEKPS